jgi:poly(3-hydroxybutyrate) depolymerase
MKTVTFVILIMCSLGLQYDGAAGQPAPQETLLFDTLHSPALEGNLIGDPTTRRYGIYLPPSYATSDTPYPVLYVLHGSTQNEEALVNPVQAASDRLIERGEIKEMIAVFVDGSNKFKWRTTIQ